jgi:hypothetical protein
VLLGSTARTIRHGHGGDTGFGSAFHVMLCHQLHV